MLMGGERGVCNGPDRKNLSGRNLARYGWSDSALDRREKPLSFGRKKFSLVGAIPTTQLGLPSRQLAAGRLA